MPGPRRVRRPTAARTATPAGTAPTGGDGFLARALPAPPIAAGSLSRAFSRHLNPCNKAGPYCQTGNLFRRRVGGEGVNVRLVSWNIAARVGRLAMQADFLATRRPDVVALQEVTARTRDGLRSSLEQMGLVQQVDTFDLGQPLGRRTGPRRYGILVASRWPLVPLAQAGLCWPERKLSTAVHHPDGPIDVHVVHVPPGSSNGWTKVEIFEGIFARLAQSNASRRVLCGDFNSPQAELATGDLVTWGQRLRSDGTYEVRRSIRGQDGARWDAAERSVLKGLETVGLVDAYRLLHGYEDDAYSFALRMKGKEVRRRFDHVLVSRDLRPMLCEYFQEPRVRGLSDHAPIEALLAAG